MLCDMCMTEHDEWRVLEDVVAYYRDVGCRPTGPIWQCRRCYFRIPLAQLRQEHAEERTNVQEYAQQEMFA